MRRLIGGILLLGLAAYAGVTIATKQIAPRLAQKSHSVADASPGAAAPDWATNTWTSDDRPYKAMESAVDEAAAHGDLKPHDIDMALQVAAAPPSNPVMIAKTAYIQYRVYRQSRQEGNMGRLLELASALPAMHSYEFSRLMFLAMMTDDYHLNTPWTPALGERLTRTKQPDIDLMSQYVKLINLANAMHLDRRFLLSCDQGVTGGEPSNARQYLLYATTYQALYFKFHIPADGRMQLAYLQKYMDTQHGKSSYNMMFAKNMATFVAKDLKNPSPH